MFTRDCKVPPGTPLVCLGPEGLPDSAAPVIESARLLSRATRLLLAERWRIKALVCVFEGDYETARFFRRAAADIEAYPKED